MPAPPAAAAAPSPDAEIGADLVKAALAALWELDGALPANVRWQQWTDTEH
ncbi:hypothetical protein [Glycomyces artemisiae]|uniref:Uncharacterized protein n=1 Tax=Glycomyces artemisiae TaxID=1076443 RepID=A0A2T0USJ0_9ACTN|nr:hypothetical protein [Glycomyces artemisiae]PRY60818.1 hypothetical protein B0I28_102430 [Glycomyces artemisiae]